MTTSARHLFKRVIRLPEVNLPEVTLTRSILPEVTWFTLNMIVRLNIWTRDKVYGTKI